LREARLLNDEEMEAISQKVCTLGTTMTIVNPKIAASWPFLRVDICPAFRGKEVCDD